MAVVSNLKTYPMSLIWETERPSRSVKSRQSSCFLLFGEEWHLKLEYFNDYAYYEVEYKVYLCSRNGKNTISGHCHVMTNASVVSGSEQFSVRSPGGVILTLRISNGSSNSYSSTTPKWKIHCHFDSQKTTCASMPSQFCFTTLAPLATAPIQPPSYASEYELIQKLQFALLQSHPRCYHLKTSIGPIADHLSTGLCPTSSKTYSQDLQDLRVGIPPDLQLLSDDLSRLLDKEIIPDATLTCGGKTWRVHRSVLTVRSEVFGAMFRSGMSESETGAVSIENLEPTVLDSLIKYVYSGKVPDVSGKNVSGLYEAADRFALLGLRKQLSSWMADHLSLENCLGFLVVADAHSDAELKDATVAFIAKHFSEIEKAVWAKFRKEHLHLVVEVLEHFAPAMKK